MYLTALNPACVELLLSFCNTAIISISVVNPEFSSVLQELYFDSHSGMGPAN